MSAPVICAAALMLLAGAPLSAQQGVAVQEVSLAADTVLDGVPCRRTGGGFVRRKAQVHAAGSLRACELSEQSVLAGHALPAGTWVYLHVDGQIDYAWLRRDTLLQGHLCRGTGYGGWQTTFYGGGALRTCWLARDEIIDGVPCSRATFLGEVRGGARTLFERDGRLRSCRAARDFAYGEERFRRGEQVDLAGIRH
jgi:hypothetical protein